MKPLLKGIRPESILRYFVCHPWQVILGVALITVFFAAKLPGLRFETSIYDLILKDLPESAQYDAFKKEFGCEEIILVVAKAKDVFEPGSFARIRELAQDLSRIPGVRQVISLPGIKKAMDITEKWDLQDFKEIIQPVTLFERNIVSRDGGTTVISLVLDDIRLKDSVISAVKEAIDKERSFSSLYQIGMPVVSKALAEFVERDFKTLPAVTFVIIILILFLFFRSLRGILIPAGSVLIGLVWTFGLMAWTGTPLSLLTMIVPIFLIAVGTAYCNYIYSEYLASLKAADSAREAAIRCFQNATLPTSLAVATTIIGLGSLLINKIDAIQEFAAFSCFGITSMLVIVLTFLPAVMGLLPVAKERPRRQQQHGKGFDRILNTLVELNFNHQKACFTIMGLIALAGIAGILRLEVETNPVGFFKEDTQVAQHFRDIYRDMAGSFPLNVAVDSKKDSYFEDPAHLQQIAELQAFLEGLPGVDKVISVVDYLKLIHYATSQYEEKAYRLPEEPFEIRMLVNSFKTMLGQDMLNRFMNGSFSKTNILLRTHIASSRDFLSIEKRIQGYLYQNFPRSFSFQVTGIGIVISHSSDLITKGQINSLFTSLGLIFAIMFLLFLSCKVGIIGMLPNIFPIIVSFGMMGWAGIPLSMETSLIASIAIGLAMDDTIHYLVHYNQEFKRDLDKKRALTTTSLHMGRPIISTTITICLGFAVLMFSHFKPTSVFGLLMVVTMFSALMADLLLLPSLMLHVELVTIWDLLKLKLGKDPQKGIPLFHGLSRTQIRHAIMAGSIKAYQHGRVVFKKGETSDAMYLIVSGELQIVDTPDSPLPEKSVLPKQVIAILKTGDVVGEMGLIRSCERSATVVASQATELLQINERMVKRLQWLYPRTAHRFFFNLMKVLCDRLENATRVFMDQRITDRLTGLHTRDFFIQVLNREVAISNSIKEEDPLSLVIISVDDLPRITLQNGYETSDTILRKIATLLKENMQGRDHLSRFNANQFACALPGTSLKDALTLCKRIQSHVEDQPFHNGSNTLYVRVNFGASATNQDGRDGVYRLIDAAFRSLDQNRGYESRDRLGSPTKSA